jgi:twitching motility two-component system response regulator PilG
MQNKILIIDDSKTIRKTAVMFLKDSGYITLVACDGIEGLAISELEKPDFIFVDVMMPKLDGINFCKAIKATAYGKNTKVWLLSGKETLLDKAKASTCGADGLILKPFEKQQLIDVLNKFFILGEK